MKMLWAFAALAASGVVSAQSHVDRAFTATGTRCDQITWSPESLAKYPRIGSACQEVMERDGKYFVKFSGELRRVAKRGQELTVAFKGGDRLTLAPPGNMSLTVDGKPTPVTALRPGDRLTFYVPGDQLSADFFEADNTTAPPQVVPIEPPVERVAEASPPPQSAPLPRTAGLAPLIGVLGSCFLLLGAALAIRRTRSEAS